MALDRIPAGLVPSSGSLNFTDSTLPDALQSEHKLAEGRWGVLHVLDGSLRYVDLEAEEERTVSAPDLVTIHPQARHLVQLQGPVRCRIDFFRELESAETMRTPGSFADEAVRRSLERCEAAGDFSEAFYRIFLTSSPEIAPHFAETDFRRQREVLRDSVHLLVTEDVAGKQVRDLLERLGSVHGREGRNIPPRLYEFWLDSICETVSRLDPEWNDDLERKWRVRLRAGMQIIMAAY